MTVRLLATRPARDGVEQVSHEAMPHSVASQPVRALPVAGLTRSVRRRTSQDLGERYHATFDALGEMHQVWTTTSADGRPVVMMASDPTPVPKLLEAWTARVDTMDDEAARLRLESLIAKARVTCEQLEVAAVQPDPVARRASTAALGDELRALLQPLTAAMAIDLPQLGAVAIYRGLHFSTDWAAKRGRTIEQERARPLADLQAEGAYSSATWEVAMKATGGAAPTREQLEAANLTVEEILERWRSTTDLTRTDDSPDGVGARRQLRDLPAMIARLEPQEEAGTISLKDKERLDQARARLAKMRKGQTFTQSGFEAPNQFMAGLSRYIDNQKYFEQDLTGSKPSAKAGKKVYSAYDGAVTSIPFISTSKVAVEAVKYAQGKVTAEAVRSTAGVVGRVLVYVASHEDMLAARGIDVWNGLRDGTLNFTTYRMAENEITLAGKIPDHFLRATTPVTIACPAPPTPEDNPMLSDSERKRLTVEHKAEQAACADAAEVEASKAAARFGGLKPLPSNKPL